MPSPPPTALLPSSRLLFVVYTFFPPSFMPSSLPSFLSVRKSNPANLALLGVIISSLGKCFLNKSIFEYACESARAKRVRAEIARRNQSWSVTQSKAKSPPPKRPIHHSSSGARLGAAMPPACHLAMKVTPTESGASEPLRVHDPPTTGLVDASAYRPEDSSSRGEGVGSEMDASKTGTLPALPSGIRKPKRKSGKFTLFWNICIYINT